MKLILILIIVFSAISGQCQTLKRKEQKIYDRYLSYKLIDSLKNSGTILHKLQTSSNKIAALKKYNKEELALETENDQKKINKTILNEYKANFTFCPVYFFYSDSINNIINGQIYGNLIAPDLKIDTNLKPNIHEYYIAQFSNVEFVYTPHEGYPSDNFVNPTTVSSKYCINLTDNKQLTFFKKPFPFYSNSIQGLNNELYKFYEKSKKPLKKRRQMKLDNVLKKMNQL